MTFRGRVSKGVVVLPAGTDLPEGTEVEVSPVTPEPVEAGDNQHDLWARLADLGCAAEATAPDLPTDLAANHDHYLHGLPKRR